MNRRNLWILAGLAGLATCLAGFTIWQSDHPAEITTNRLLFPELTAHAGDIAKVEIASAEQTITIARKGKNWVLPAKTDYPADGDRVSAVIDALAHIAPIEEKTSDPARYPELNLGPPGRQKGGGKEIRLLDAKGAVLADAVIGRIAINLGKVGGGFYIRRTDDPASWLAEGTLDLPENPLDWTHHDLFDLSDPAAIKTATVQAGSKTIVTVSRDKPDDETFTIAPAPPGKQDEGKGLRLITIPISLSFDDVRPAGNDDTGSAVSRTASFQGFTPGIAYRIEVLGAGKENWVRVSESGGSDAVRQFNDQHGKWLYRLPAYREELLLAGPRDYAIKTDPEAKKAK